MATVESLITAEEYRVMPDNGQPTELVRGRIVPLNVPYPRHGEICSRIVYLLCRFLEDHDLGRVVSNDSGVVTEHDPDTVRGPDVAFYSYARIPKGPLPDGYLDVVPELLFEVRSPGDPWSKVFAKIGEFLTAGVRILCVLDPPTETAHVFVDDQPVRVFQADEELLLAPVLTDFRLPVRRFFE
jgi:Uma2 family endonuclease